MAGSKYHVGDHTLKTTGNITMTSEGDFATFQAIGTESSVLVSGTQAVNVISGDAVFGIQNSGPEEGKMGVNVGEAGSIVMNAGPPVGGVTIKLQGPELLEMTVGAPGVGASITMTPESITFKVAETSFTLSPEGIIEDVGEVTREATVEGHNLTAAETELNVGVEGFVMEGPSLEAEYEGGTVINESLGEVSTDAAKSVEASITMMV